MRSIYAQSLMHSQSKEMGFGPLRGGKFKMNYRGERVAISCSEDEEEEEESMDEDMEGFVVDSVDEGPEEEDGLEHVDEWEEEQARKPRMDNKRSRKVIVDDSEIEDDDESQGSREEGDDSETEVCDASPDETRRGLKGRLKVWKRKGPAAAGPSPSERRRDSSAADEGPKR
eukprot:1687901-Rhodomonas_salina.1